MTKLGVNEVGFKGYAPRFRADEAQQTQTATKVTYPADSFSHEEEGMSTTSKVLVGAGIVGAIALGIWALMRGKGGEEVKNATQKAGEGIKEGAQKAGEAVKDAIDKVKNKAKQVAEGAKEKLRKATGSSKKKPNAAKPQKNATPNVSGKKKTPQGKSQKTGSANVASKTPKNNNAPQPTVEPKPADGVKPQAKSKVKSEPQVKNESKSQVKPQPKAKPVKVDPKVKADKQYQKLDKGAVDTSKVNLVSKDNDGNDLAFGKWFYSQDGKKPFTGTTRFVHADGSVLFTSYKNGKANQVVYIGNEKGRIERTITNYKKGLSPINTATEITETSYANGSFKTVDERDGHYVFRNLNISKDGSKRGEILDPKTLLVRRFKLNGSSASKSPQYDEVIKIGGKVGEQEKVVVDLMALSPKKRAAAVKKLPQYLFADVK